jgi:hypothetical protein
MWGVIVVAVPIKLPRLGEKHSRRCTISVVADPRVEHRVDASAQDPAIGPETDDVDLETLRCRAPAAVSSIVFSFGVDPPPSSRIHAGHSFIRTITLSGIYQNFKVFNASQLVP